MYTQNREKSVYENSSIKFFFVCLPCKTNRQRCVPTDNNNNNTNNKMYTKYADVKNNFHFEENKKNSRNIKAFKAKIWIYMLIQNPDELYVLFTKKKKTVQ
jgi:hypothetical protein